MNGTAMTLAFPEGLPPIGDSVVLFGVPSERLGKKQLAGSVEEILRNVASILNSMILSAIEKKTAHEFRAVYIEGFPVYIRLIGVLSEILQATVKRSVIERMVSESYSELEAEIREHARAFFGDEMKEQASFTVWTLRKIDELTNVVIAGKVPDGEKQRDREYTNQFLVAALWARFNIDCLTVSMRSGKAIYPEVLVEISDGIRGAVNAYAWIKQAAAIRSPLPDVEFAFEMDDEDKELLRESMYDMDHEEVG